MLKMYFNHSLAADKWRQQVNPEFKGSGSRALCELESNLLKGGSNMGVFRGLLQVLLRGNTRSLDYGSLD